MSGMVSQSDQIWQKYNVKKIKKMFENLSKEMKIENKMEIVNRFGVQKLVFLDHL